jgi:hypothetical protein
MNYRIVLKFGVEENWFKLSKFGRRDFTFFSREVGFPALLERKFHATQSASGTKRTR